MKVGSATGTVSADPKFVSYNPTGTGDYRLQSTSPAINKGTSSYAPTTDFLGAARPSGGAFDIGAYEMGATTSTSTATWTYCATENGTCSFSGTRQVRYGANGMYYTKTFTGSTLCSNSVFGDPIVGTVKSCSYSSITQ
jgi:hypothetical protein